MDLISCLIACTPLECLKIICTENARVHAYPKLISLCLVKPFLIVVSTSQFIIPIVSDFWANHFSLLIEGKINANPRQSNRQGCV